MSVKYICWFINIIKKKKKENLKKHLVDLKTNEILR